jgi:hypothetical protein
MSEDETDFLVRRAEYSENLGDQHINTAMEFKKAAILYKEAFGYFKKAGDKKSCIRIKEKYDGAVSKMKEKESE